MRRSTVVASLLLALAPAAACSSSPGASGGSPPPAHGTATVDYAGSLTGLVETTLQPAFEHASGDSLVGKGAGSTDIARGILDGELAPGAFVSVGRKAIELLWPKRSRFVVSLATDPLVVAYSARSRYAGELDAIRAGRKPLSDLFGLMAAPGFRLARTNPIDDPQGAYFILMCQLAERELHLPAGTAAKILGTSASDPTGSSSQIVAETSLPTDVASGSFDAGSDFVTEARQYHLDYITLPAAMDFADPADVSTYSTVTLHLATGPFVGDLITLDETYVLPGRGENRPPADAAADEAFVAYLLSDAGRSLLRNAGYVLEKPVATLAPGVASASAAMTSSVLAAFDKAGGQVSTP